MPYKTLALGLIQSHPTLHQHLRRTRQLRHTLETCAVEMRMDHRAVTDVLAQKYPRLNRQECSTAALELVVADLQRRLSADATHLVHDPNP